MLTINDFLTIKITNQAVFVFIVTFEEKISGFLRKRSEELYLI